MYAIRSYYVQRSADPNDARVKLISLTPKGQRKVREIEEFMFDLHQQLLSQIDPSQRANVITALETLRTSMEAVKAQFLDYVITSYSIHYTKLYDCWCRPTKA